MLYKELFILFFLQILVFFLLRKKTLKYIIKGNLIDRPSDKKIHKKKVPVTGGIVCFLSLIFYIIFSITFSNGYYFINDDIVVILIGIIFAFLIGLIDDILDLKVEKKIAIITVFNILLFQNISFFNTTNLIFDNSFFNYEISISSLSLAISILGFLTYHYALVIIDGINGLFGLYTLFFLIIIFYYFDINIQLKNFIFYLILIIAFLSILNIKNLLFFGNSGSLMLAALLPYLILYLYNEKINKFYFFEIITIIIIPVLDMIRLFILRLFFKKNPFSKDLNHFHHLLLKRFSTSFSLLLYMSLCFLPFIFCKHGLNPIIAIITQIVVFVLLTRNLKIKNI